MSKDAEAQEPLQTNERTKKQKSFGSPLKAENNLSIGQRVATYKAFICTLSRGTYIDGESVFFFKVQIGRNILVFILPYSFFEGIHKQTAYFHDLLLEKLNWCNNKPIGDPASD